MVIEPSATAERHGMLSTLGELAVLERRSAVDFPAPDSHVPIFDLIHSTASLASP